MMKMLSVFRRGAAACGAVMAIALAGSVSAQGFPSKPVRLIVPFAPGGVVDITARQLGQKMSDAMGQPFIIENRPGASGSIAAEQVAKSPADGYTLLVAFDTHAVNPHVYKNLRFDTFKDLAPISSVGTIPLLLVANNAFPATDVAGVIKAAKAGNVSYGSVGAGSSGHLAAEQFKLLAGIDMLHVPFKGGAPAISALMGDQVQMVIGAAAAFVPLVNAGKIKAVAVSGNKLATVLPNVPTMAEAGFPQLNSGAWMGLLAPAGTPKAVIDQLQAEVAKATRDPELVKRLAEQAIELSSSTPEAFGSFVRAEHDKWGKLIKDAKLNIQQ